MAIDVAEAGERGLVGTRRSGPATVYSKNGKTFASMSGSIVDGLEGFASQIPAITRRIAYAGARAMYDEMLVRVPVESGGLRDSIYHKFLDEISQGTSKSYAIGPNKRRAPHWHNVEYGHFRYNMAAGPGFFRKSVIKKKTRTTPAVHGGPGALPVPEWVPASPYIRPTFDALKGSVIQIMRGRASELVRGFK